MINVERTGDLVRAVPPPNVEALRRVSAFLDEREVGRLLRGLLRAADGR